MPELSDNERAVVLAALGLYRDSIKDEFLPHARSNGLTRLAASWERHLEVTEAVIEKIEEAE